MTERVLGPTGSRRRKRWMLIGPLVVLAFTLVFGATAAIASHPEESLASSNFEIDTDANTKVDDASPSIDWNSVTEIKKNDTPSGNSDESFGQGSKEDTAVPSIVDGGIPPNKSDLKSFGVYQEGSTSSGFLNLYWSRVQDPSGTTNMDFEFNKRQCTPNATPADADCSGNGQTPIRSTGDLLVIYDLAQGGTHPVLSLREWTGSAWGAPVDLTASSKATGSINTTAIPAGESGGLGAQSARTFGEAQLALSEIFGSSTCESFGSAYLKSRSSDSFTAALKDFVPPVPVDISNCGRVVVKKTTGDGTTGLAGASFTITPANSDNPSSSSLSLVSGSTSVFCIDHLLIGTQYTIHESVVPDGYNGAQDQTFTPSTSGSCTSVTGSTTPDLTFVNTPKVGAIKITKTGKDAACTAANTPTGRGCSAAKTRTQVAVFEIFTGENSSTGKVGGDRTTGSDGTICIDGLALGKYTVHEKTPPTGYAAAPDANVTVAEGTCAATTFASANFLDQPLTDVTLSVAPQVAGTTASKISCDKGTFADGTPNDFNDTSETYTSVALPSAGGTTTVTCTIVIDP